jgi:aspartyl-tRNA(Asn)/glutamyl-tRNA(Gln) amidotransferase subunit B
LPEMPGARRSRLASEHGLPVADVALISANRALADLLEEVVKLGADAKTTANWIIGEVAPSGKVPPAAHLAEIVKLVFAGSITRDQGREVLSESLKDGRSPADIVAQRGFAQDSDESSVRSVVEAVLAANPRAVEDYKAGRKQAIGALMADLKHRAPQTDRKLAMGLLIKLLE